MPDHEAGSTDSSEDEDEKSRCFWEWSGVEISRTLRLSSSNMKALRHRCALDGESRFFVCDRYIVYACRKTEDKVL